MASSSVQSRVVPDATAIVTHASLCGLRGPSLRRSFYKHNSTRRQTPMICASSAAPYGPGGGSEIVDSNMTVLRQRIHRLRSLEEMEGAPEDWMEWEKSCYPGYRADVAYIMAGLQRQLLGMRPSLSLFILSVILSAMPVASLVVLRLVLLQWTAY